MSKIASSCLTECDSKKDRGSLWWVFKDGKEQDMITCRNAKYKLQGASETKDSSSTVSVEVQCAVQKWRKRHKPLFIQKIAERDFMPLPHGFVGAIYKNT